MVSKLVAATILVTLCVPGDSVLAADELLSPVPEVAAKNVTEDRYPVHNVTFLNGVRGIPSVVYSELAGYRPLTLDLYLPPDFVDQPASGFPLVIYIHGGGWRGGDSHRSGPFVDFPGVLSSLSARGYVVASIEYRLSSEALFPAPIQDVKAAIRWLRSRASEIRIDPARAMTWGVSAGGHLAGLAAVSCNAAAIEPHTAKSASSDAKPDTSSPFNFSDCVQGGVSWYGVFDMATIAAHARQDGAMSRFDAAVWQLLGCTANGCEEGQVAAASPVTYVDAKDPPMLLIVGAEDKIVPYHQTLKMADKLKSVGVQHELIVLPGIDHSFIGKTSEQTRDANLKALAATFRFFDRWIGKADSTNGQP